MTMKSKRFSESHAWRFIGLGLAMMSVFAAGQGVWRNVVTSLAAIVLATSLGRARTRCVR